MNIYYLCTYRNKVNKPKIANDNSSLLVDKRNYAYSTNGEILIAANDGSLSVVDSVWRLSCELI